MLNQIYFNNADFTLNNWINQPGSTDEGGIAAYYYLDKLTSIFLQKILSNPSITSFYSYYLNHLA